jgi:D-arabinose 1-dehydrogenase-like Zn-dependent alcohol dehydrogenase
MADEAFLAHAGVTARGASVAGRQGPSEERGRDCAQPFAPGPGEILVRVQACGVSRVERALSTGAVSQLCACGAPYISGMDAAGTVIATGDGVTRFAVGDEVFGHFPAESWTWAQAPCARTNADGGHVELRPEGLDQLAAAALAEAGLTATTILRAAAPGPDESALVIGATSGPGTVLVPLLAEAGVRVIAAATPEDDAYVRSLGAAETFDHGTTDPAAYALARHPEAELLVDLVSLDEPYFITPGATQGTIVTALPPPEGDARVRDLGVPRIGISAEPGDLAGLVRRALDGSQPVELAHLYSLQEVGRALPATHGPADEPPLALAG